MRAGRKLWAAAGILAFAATCAFGQNLVDAAKKEKERREGLKGKPATAVTNADLSGVKKKPAVIPEKIETPPGGEAGSQAPGTAAALPGSGAEPGTTVKSAEDLQAEALKGYAAQKAELEDRYAKAKEQAELLGLKMNALWQQFYSFNSMQTKDQTQQLIGETYQRLLEARAEEKKAKEDLDDFLSRNPKGKQAVL